MARIYFDTNIFSNLKANTRSEFKRINELLVEYKDNLSFFFSSAHMLDKKNDLSERKYEDFVFMETMVENNYLEYYEKGKYTKSYLATPIQVYEKVKDHFFDVKSIRNAWSPEEDDSPDILFLKNQLRELYTNTKFPIDTEVFKDVPEEALSFINKIIPLEMESITLMDVMERQLDFYKDLFTNFETYKELRKVIDEGINKGKYILNDDSFDFQTAFQDSALKKTFHEHIVYSLGKEGEKIPQYNYLLQAYNTLDHLGISKDRINKKNGYDNLFNDGLHCYYASYCDCLVTEDAGLLKKSKAIFDLLDIETIVLTPVEFEVFLARIGKPTELDVDTFIEKLKYDVRNGDRYTKSDDYNNVRFYIDVREEYFNFFDAISVLSHEDGLHFILCKKMSNKLSQPNYKESGQIIGRCLRLFGLDTFQKGEFKFEKESEEIEQGIWRGRSWTIDSLDVHIMQTDSIGFSLVVGPFSVANDTV